MFKALKDRIQGKAPGGAKRSSQWPKVRKEHLAREPKCRVCGESSKLEVHHIVPFHADPTKELDPANLMTLCESAKGGIICHLAIGHLGNYQRINEWAIADAKFWRGRLKG